MMLVFLSVAVVLIAALGLALYSRRRPMPPIPVIDPLGGPWPPDEAREMLDAWRDQTSA